ncbi:MAG: pyroglutamyl-peptidase I [Clostridia bacterium]|nr:pyroglutamyl-peptidase I [Clostridia bacterium]
MRILLTGFEPFGGEEVNPSWQAVLKAAKKIDFAEISTVCLPVEYYRSVDAAIKAVNDFCPDAVLLTGQAGGRTCVSFENAAVNIADSDTGDNAGRTLHTVNCQGGPDRLFSTLPVKEMVDAVNKSGFPAYISQNAGRFVCNHVFYGVLKYVSENKSDIKVGFAHVPFIPAQTVNKPEKPSMSLENIADCLVAALEVLK